MSRPTSHSPPARGFTLVELLIVISIIAILISLLFVGYPKINTMLKERTCQGNLRSIGQVLAEYCQRNRGFYPDTDGFWGCCFERTAGSGSVLTPPWTALSNVRDLKEMGATEALFTCPFSVTPPGTPWWGTWDTPAFHPASGGYDAYYEVDLTSYTLLFNRGNGAFGANTWSYPLGDGRPSVTTNACKANMPIVADILFMNTTSNTANQWAAGWFHGGGYLPQGGGDPIQFFYGPTHMQSVDQTVSSGFNVSACNTLFAGGYVVHSEPGEFQDPTGKPDPNHFGIQMDNTLTFWFALQPNTK